MNNLGNPVAYLLPTGRCNLKCEGCYATLEYAGRHSARGELSLDEYRRAVDELVGLGVRIFDISGGEAMLYPHLVPLCQAIRSHPGTRIWLVTNGTMARAGMLEALAPLVERLVVSLDAPYAELHDSMRGRRGAFDLSLETLRRARRLRFNEVAVNQLLTAGNAHSVADMLRLCRDESIDRLALLSFRDVSENGLMADLVPDLPTLQNCWRGVAEFLLESEHPRLVDLVAPAFLHPEARAFLRTLPRALRGRLSFHHVHLRGVTAFRESIVIKPHGQLTGDTAMSNFDEFDLGSARLGVGHVWESMAPAWRERLATREARLRAEGPCGGCPRWNVCRGGCPAAALHQWGEVERYDRTCDRFRAAGYF